MKTQYVGQKIVLDNSNYTDCEFRNCAMHFDGGDFSCVGCSFNGCTWHFGKGALGGIALLAHIYFVEPNREDAESFLHNSLRKAMGERFTN